MTYRYPLYVLTDNGSDFYFDKGFRHHVATFHMNEHDCKHRSSWFKYGCECRYFLPKPCCNTFDIVDEIHDDSKLTIWRSIGKEDTNVYPFAVKTKRGMGSQFLNTHSRRITEALACNSNIQMGSPRCVFYVIHYSTKSTQKEDCGIDYDRIGKQVMQRIQNERNRIDFEIASGNTNATEEINHLGKDCVGFSWV